MWNANGVSRYKLGIIQFFIKKHIDVMLLADTHLTGKLNFHLYQDLAEKKYFFNYKKKTNFKNFPCLRIYISSCSYPIDFIFFLYLVL